MFADTRTSLALLRWLGLGSIACVWLAAACVPAAKLDRLPRAPRPTQAPAPVFDAGSYYRVQGVRLGDRLNVRAQPDASAEILTGLAPDQSGVLWSGMSSSSGKSRWWRIDADGVEGWVNAAFLAPAPKPPGRALTLACTGTEPFWGLVVSPDGRSTCDGMCEGPAGLVASLRPMAAGPWWLEVVTRERAVFLTGSLVVEACSDGMSDFGYLWSVALRLASGIEYRGCCRVRSASPARN